MRCTHTCNKGQRGQQYSVASQNTPDAKVHWAMSHIVWVLEVLHHQAQNMVAMQAKVYDRSKEPQHICDILQPHVQDAELCMKLARVLQGMLDPSLAHRLTARKLLESTDL